MSDTVLVKLDLARAALAECRTVMEAKQIADIAEAARVYLERTNASVETVNRATEIRALAERQMGEFLKVMPDAKRGPKKLASGGEANFIPSLSQIGITEKQSARAQKLADIPAPEFAERIAVAKASGGKLSMTKLVEERRVKTRPKHVESEREFKVRIQRVISFCLQAIPTGMEKAAATVLRVLADQLEKT